MIALTEILPEHAADIEQGCDEWKLAQDHADAAREELIDRMCKAAAAGASIRQMAKIVELHPATVDRWMKEGQ